MCLRTSSGKNIKKKNEKWPKAAELSIACHKYLRKDKPCSALHFQLWNKTEE